MTYRLNSLEVYAECGRRAGVARNQHDESRARFEGEWLRKAIAIESPEYRPIARQAFDDAYRAARMPQTMHPMNRYLFGRS